MNLSQLRSLVEIDNAGGFSSAAENLFITPSAISHQMRDLEQDLGVALFDRDSRPPRLNAHGRALVERGRDLLARFDLLVEQAKTPGKIGGRLMLGCVSGVSSELIPRTLANLRASHPALQISIEEGLSEALADRVRKRELDAAIITELPEADPQLTSLVITQETMMVVAPPDCRLRDWREILESYPFIRLNRSAGMGKVIDRALRGYRLQVEEAMELDSSETVVGMAQAGIGAGVIPIGRLRRVPAGAVVSMPFGEPPIYRRVVLIERSNNPRSDLSRLVYDSVREVTAAAQ